MLWGNFDFLSGATEYIIDSNFTGALDYTLSKTISNNKLTISFPNGVADNYGFLGTYQLFYVY